MIKIKNFEDIYNLIPRKYPSPIFNKNKTFAIVNIGLDKISNGPNEYTILLKKLTSEINEVVLLSGVINEYYIKYICNLLKTEYNFEIEYIGEEK